MKRLAAILIILIFPMSAFCFDDVSVGMFSGGQISFNDHWRNHYHDYNLDELSMSLGKYLDEGKKWKIECEFLTGFFTDKYQSYVESCRSLGFNLHIKRELCRISVFTPYIGTYGGLSILSPHNNQSDFENSGALGTFGGYAGVKFPVSDRQNVLIAFRIMHTSDPFNTGDMGRNHQGISVRMSWEL